MKGKAILAAALYSVAAIIGAAAMLDSSYKAKETTSLDFAQIIDANELSLEELESRNGNLIIERTIGVVDDSTNGDGHEVNDKNSYICYASVDGISNGDIICTYFIYNPETNYADDILMRFDYIINKQL